MLFISLRNIQNAFYVRTTPDMIYVFLLLKCNLHFLLGHVVLLLINLTCQSRLNTFGHIVLPVQCGSVYEVYEFHIIGYAR